MNYFPENEIEEIKEPYFFEIALRQIDPCFCHSKQRYINCCSYKDDNTQLQIYCASYGKKTYKKKKLKKKKKPGQVQQTPSPSKKGSRI